MGHKSIYIDRAPGRFIDVEGEEFLFFAGASYLGLHLHPSLQSLFVRYLAKLGANVGTSRMNNIRFGIYDEGESFFAQQFEFEGSLLFSSGFLASRSAVDISVEQADKVYCSPFIHPSLVPSGNPMNKKVVQSSAGSIPEWIEEINREVAGKDIDRLLLISNTVDNLYPQQFDFSSLNKLHANKQITLILDDSHGIGLLNKGKVSLRKHSLPTNVELVVVASLAKVFCIDAGLVLASESVINKIRSSANFIGASPPSPAGIASLLEGWKYYEENWGQLQSNLLLLNRYAESEKIKMLSNMPVLTAMKGRWYEMFYKNKMIISSFPYPYSHSESLDRVIVSALHKEEDIIKLMELLNQASF
ncbi:MAG TPA: aminotransferase class I/II-fold pyridoxal phosphate-dependent enzyme [Candidatus Sphingobacterium stercoripullorum]|uniref:Aminotransferase class I/II-fold pyridoxal phosphate-dependent enzyme n=1 Tax=Candidatus Sphingobacterium stercoripullorum TaxID=2838759 RepID=A0A9D2AYT3_9SPHI|nr:aminotransferase class I/II-fold pyridoxal phosphate-dependent enzyme [Candidatus Sphingobacterium stercoripullorum]